MEKPRKKSSPRGISSECIECPVCFEMVPESDFVMCSCTSRSCRECTKEYILSNFQVAHCMTCRVEWTNKFLAANFTKKWLDDNTDKGYRHHRKKCALDREKSLIPETLLKVPSVNAEKEKEALISSLKSRNKVIKSEIADIKQCLQNGITYKGYLAKQEIKRLEKELNTPNLPSKRYTELSRAMINLSKKNANTTPTTADLIEDRDKIKALESELLSNKKSILLSNLPETTVNLYEDKEYKVEFLCTCPYPSCRGMVTVKKLKCVVCYKKICKECREPLELSSVEHTLEKSTSTFFKGEKCEHFCNFQILENIKLLKEDTKPCPKCAVGIFRIQGCSQMFCTNCKISFSWDTGKINAGRVHNPHAIEWFRQSGNLDRDILDIPCGGLPQVFHIVKYEEVSDDLFETIVSIYQVVAELDEKIEKCVIEDFEDIRMDYVLGKKTEKQWESAIFTRERNNERKKVLSDIYVTFRTISVERFRQLYEDLEALRVRNTTNGGGSEVENTKKSIKIYVKAFIENMNEVKTFINSTLSEELVLLGTAKPIQILDSWQWSNK